MPVLPTSTSSVNQPVFRRFLLMRCASGVAFQVAGVASGWQMYTLTHSTFALGMMGLIQFLPVLLLTLVVGSVADRYPRELIVGLCQTIEAVLLAVLAVGSYSGWIHPAHLYLCMAFFAAARAFEMPSTQALTPSLVELPLVPAALALSSLTNRAAFILGPAVGGLLYTLGAHVPYAAGVVLYGAASILSFQLPAQPNRASGEGQNKSIFSGVRFILARRDILGAISLDLFAVLFGGVTALLPAFTRDILHTDSRGLGILRLAPAVGAVTVSVILARYPIQRNAGRKMFAAVIVFGLAIVGFAFSRSLWLSAAILVVAGSADIVSVLVRSSLVQLGTPDHMRGRVTAVSSLFINTSLQLGEFESGVTASWVGIVPATAIGGFVTIVVAALWMRFFPNLLGVKSLSMPDELEPGNQRAGSRRAP